MSVFNSLLHFQEQYRTSRSALPPQCLSRLPPDLRSARARVFGTEGNVR